MLHCPSCDVAMERREMSQGLFWGCRKCMGSAFSIGVLRRTLDAKAIWELWSKSSHQEEDGKCCPICRKAMRRIEVESNIGLQELEVCRRCQFVWFDGSEYGVFTEGRESKDLGVPETKPLPQAAREALALAEVERIRERSLAEGPSNQWDYLPAILGLPVECQSEEVSRPPWVTGVLVCLVAALSIWGFINPSFIEWFGLRPSEVWERRGLTLVSSFFLHGGILHLIGNLYFFWVFGDNVEDFLGARRYLVLLLAATLAGGLTHLLADPQSDRICIGASGGISGVIAFYALRFPAARLGFLFGYTMAHYQWFTLSARSALWLWLILQFWVAFNQVRGFGNVSALAHLGGAALGALVWYLWAYSPDPPAQTN